LKKETEFYSKMILFCRDGNNLEFNRDAWSLFHQMIYCHQGVLEHLIKANMLAPFLELVGTSYNNIIVSNGLHFITKVFLMWATEQRVQQEGKTPTRAMPGEKDLGMKSFEKDTKILNKFFVDRRLFIKVHMIYKKLIPTYAGAPFLELANFYNQLVTSPCFHKLYKDTSKQAEYKIGIQRIQAMFTPENEDAIPSPKPTVTKSNSFGTVSPASLVKSKIIKNTKPPYQKSSFNYMMVGD